MALDFDNRVAVVEWLKTEWKRALKRDQGPDETDDFFDLGGDSLASSELVFAIEEITEGRVVIDSFFDMPTLIEMADFLYTSMAEEGQSPARDDEAQHWIIRKLGGFVASWEGGRNQPASLLVGQNTDGARIPLFWVFQSGQEMRRLAVAMGPDQPVYGMRSFVEIVEVEEYTDDLLDVISQRYLTELLNIAGASDFVLGGNCQGGIIALRMAQKLRQMGRAPTSLVLHEWSFSHGSYPEPCALLYGLDSYCAEIYEEGPLQDGPDWRQDFPQNSVVPVPGAHGFFFEPDFIGAFAKAIMTHTSPRPTART